MLDRGGGPQIDSFRSAASETRDVPALADRDARAPVALVDGGIDRTLDALATRALGKPKIPSRSRPTTLGLLSLSDE